MAVLVIAPIVIEEINSDLCCADVCTVHTTLVYTTKCGRCGQQSSLSYTVLSISSSHLYSVHCSGLVHWSLLASLDVENLILVLMLVLLEQKVVFHSGRPTLLTAVGEAIKSVLHVLSKVAVYRHTL